MARKSKAISYQGDLAKPIREISDAASAQAEFARRFNLLCEVYNIDLTDHQAFVKLTFALAINHVPGLHFDLKPGPGGRATEWTEQRLASLALSVDELKKKGHASTDKEACEQLIAGRQARTWGRPAKNEGTSEQWQRHLKNMVLKGRKTLTYRITTSPPGLRELYELCLPADTSMEPDENGSYLGALVKGLIT